jgi:hypothetical protein
MKILAIEKELQGGKTMGMQEFLKAEAERVWQLYQKGFIREAYFHAEHHVAVFMLECGGEQEARQELQTLPMVQAGLIEFDILPLVPYDGWARLFS